MITTKTKKLGFISGLLVITVAGGLFFLFSQIITQGNDVIATAQAVNDHSVQNQTSAKMTEILESTAEKRAMLSNTELNESDTIDFLSEIEALAITQQVVLSTDTLEIVGEGTDRLLRVQFSIEGMSNDVEEMISILESLPYASYIEQMQLSSQDTDNGDTSAMVILKIVMSAS